MTLATRSPAEIRQRLLSGEEIALIDVREEGSYATGHPLFAVNIPFSKLELTFLSRVPRHRTPIVFYDNGEGLASRAAEKVTHWGYIDVAILDGGVEAWILAGEEVFIDVNSPSKAFGEWVEHHQKTPSLSAEEVDSLLNSNADIKIFDVRRFDEYQTMNIPGSTSLPGGELLLRIKDLLPSEDTQVVINCAGRTRSIIGTQTLINAGIVNPVAALRNGTIGWTLAGKALEHQQQRQYQSLSEQSGKQARFRARQVAERAGVQQISLEQLTSWQNDHSRTTYFFDVRSAEEFLAGHLVGSQHVPGGQLVQETDHYASVRGARIVLFDQLETRADITASWLAQMNWEVAVLIGVTPQHLTEQGPHSLTVPKVVESRRVSAQTLLSWQEDFKIALLDFTTSANYLNGHIPNAYWLLKSDIERLVAQHKLPDAERYVVTCGSSLLASYAVQELEQLTQRPVYILEGGNNAWKAAELPLEKDISRLLSTPNDRYKRPYEGTDVEPETMQSYLEWEYGLVEQLNKDGTHGFSTLTR